MPKLKVRVQAAIFDAQHRLLLAKHVTDSEYWVLPGGGVELYERMDEALARELREELGFEKVQVRDILFIDEYIDRSKDKHVLLVCFYVKCREQDLGAPNVVAKGESIREVSFFTPEQIQSSNDTFYPSKEIIMQIIEETL